MRAVLFTMALFVLIGCGPAEQKAKDQQQEITIKENYMLTALKNYADSLTFEFEEIPVERRLILKELAQYISEQRDSGNPVNLIFICTHNSRRSHMAQIWAAAAAKYYQIENIGTFSGGTEATAFNPRAVAALQRAGFKIDNPGGENPRYNVIFSDTDEKFICFSKKFDDPANPSKDFAAIMTCSQADEECPYIPGAKFRLSLPYNDPKEADGTPEETARYDERCRQIGREIMYAFSLL